MTTKQDEKQTGRGGKREGAGRPFAAVKTANYAVRVPEEDKPFLMAVPDQVKKALHKIAEAERKRQAEQTTENP